MDGENLGAVEPLRLARLADAAGEYGTADRLFQSVLANDPGNTEALFRLGVIAAQTGNSDLAIQRLQELLKREPDSVEAMSWLASLLRTPTRLSEAIELCERALRIEPNNSRILFGLALCHLDRWHNLLAIQLLQQAIQSEPEFAAAYDRLGAAYAREARADEAISAFEMAIKLQPNLSVSHANIAQLYANAERIADAADAYSRALKAAEGSYSQLLQLSGTLAEMGESDQAAVAARMAIALSPAEAPAYLALARILNRVGRFDEARETLAQALEIRPDGANLYFERAYCQVITESDRGFAESITALLRRPALSLHDRAKLHYALGKCYDDLGDYRRALQHFDEANGIELRRLPPGSGDRELVSGTTRKIIEMFSPAFIQKHRGVGSDSELPILVVGMIRSGTTLTEQILSSHPLIGAGGELGYLPDHYREAFNRQNEPEPELARAVADGYVRRLRFAAPGKARVTDKRPADYALAGIAHLMFPNARIIHCRRNPLDTCLSIYLTPHPEPLDLIHSAANIGFSYGQYLRLMAHWRQVLPADRFFEFDYEDLVSDPEPVVRRLISFLGLPWDDACLRPQENAHAIDTPSRWQARQQIYKTSLDRWKKYEPFVAELRQALPPEVQGFYLA